MSKLDKWLAIISTVYLSVYLSIHLHTQSSNKYIYMYIGALWLDSQPSVIILSHPIRRLHSWCWYTQNPRLWVHLLAALGPLAESRRSKPNKGGLFCSNQRLSLQNEPGAEPGRSFAVGNMLPAGRPAGRPTQPARPRSEQCVGYRLSAEGGEPLLSFCHCSTRTCKSFWLCVSASSSSDSSVCCSSSPSQP